jgi:2-hydroxymuconate-semialdehyde hydrolase
MTELIEIDQYKAPYCVMGDGPPVLCSELPLNPFARFGPLQEKLAMKSKVFLIDLRPVVGYSDRTPPSDDLLEFLSDFSLKAMDTLGIHQFSLIGSFMYGGVSMNIARKAPGRVRSLMLLGSLGILRLPITPLLRFITIFYRCPGIPSLFRLLPFRAFVEWTDHYIVGPKRLYEIFYEPKKVPVSLEDLYEQYKTPRNASAALALMWTIRKLTYEKLIPRLHEIKCPSLIIHGAEDQWVPLRYAKELHSRLLNSTLAVIPQTRHMPEVEQVDLAYKHIEVFLEEHAEYKEQ